MQRRPSYTFSSCRRLAGSWPWCSCSPLSSPAAWWPTILRWLSLYYVKSWQQLNKLKIVHFCNLVASYSQVTVFFIFMKNHSSDSTRSPLSIPGASQVIVPLNMNKSCLWRSSSQFLLPVTRIISGDGTFISAKLPRSYAAYHWHFLSAAACRSTCSLV